MSNSDHRSFIIAVLVMASSLTAALCPARALAQTPSKGEGGAVAGPIGHVELAHLLADVGDDMSPESTKALLGYDVERKSFAPIWASIDEDEVDFVIKVPSNRSETEPLLSYSETVNRLSHARTSFSIWGSFNVVKGSEDSCFQVRELDQMARVSGWSAAGSSSMSNNHSFAYVKGPLHLRVETIFTAPPVSGSIIKPETDNSCVEMFSIGTISAPAAQ